MTADRWKRVEDIFLGACEVAEDARRAYVLAQCGEDETLRSEVQSLLALEGRVGSVGFLSTSVLDVADRAAPEDATADAGRRIGPYRLVERIGTGGMGAVWLAERADQQFEHRVAIKSIRAEFDSDEILHRFRTERQLLARLNHPNICRLLDGGADAEGRPYLVMEYVAGMPIDAYCDEHRLTVHERLELFCDVSAAVQHAHQHLVVHRDLKPSNIFVTTDRSVKLLDFGIAKVLHEEAHSSVTVTLGAQRHFTPAYASPEQVRGEPITTATDVYSLGMVLYELLTGRRPYRIETSSPREIESIICATQPTKPSDVIDESPERTPVGERTRSHETVQQIAANRSTDPVRLKRALRGDLDVILLTALRKEPQRRYASATALAADLRRYLAHEPISARPDSWGYRTSMFIRRHRWAVTTAAAILTLIVTASIAVTVLAFRIADRSTRLSTALGEITLQKAEIEMEYGRAITASLIYTRMLSEVAQSDEVVRANLIAELQRRSDRLDAMTLPLAPAAEISAREAIGRVARGVGAHDVALRQFTRIIELSEGNAAERRAHVHALSLAGATYFDLGDYDQAIAVLSAVLASQSNTPLQDDDLLLCEALLIQGRRDDAIAAVHRAPLPSPPFDQALRERIADFEARFAVDLLDDTGE